MILSRLISINQSNIKNENCRGPRAAQITRSNRIEQAWLCDLAREGDGNLREFWKAGWRVPGSHDTQSRGKGERGTYSNML